MDIIDTYIQEYAAVIHGVADSKEVDAILEEFGVSDLLYRDWLIRSGGGPIGPDWYDSVSQLRESQLKLSEEDWSISGFVIGWDGAGNPMVLDKDGMIRSEDHNFGGIHTIASSFSNLIRSHVNTEPIE